MSAITSGSNDGRQWQRRPQRTANTGTPLNGSNLIFHLAAPKEPTTQPVPPFILQIAPESRPNRTVLFKFEFWRRVDAPPKSFPTQRVLSPYKRARNRPLSWSRQECPWLMKLHTYGLLRDSCRLVHELESVRTIWRLRDRHVKEKRMRITGYLILRHRQTGDHNIRVVREAQTIHPVS